MTLGRILAGLAVVAAGGATALAVGALPALGSPAGPIAATPSSAAQRLVCPGSAVAVGGSSAAALTASGGTARTAAVEHGAVVSARLGTGTVTGSSKTAPRLLTAPPQPTAGILAGVQLQTVATGDAQGLAAAACTAPVATSWLAAGSTTTGRTAVLLLANPSTVDAEVRVRAWTEQGPVSAAGTAAVVVPARGRTAVPVASIAPDAAGTVLEVVSSGGQVAAALEQRVVRGLESGGIDVTGPTVAPATSAVVPGVRVLNAASIAQASAQDGYADVLPVARVLVPGGAGGTVTVHATSATGAAAATVTRAVAAGSVTDLPLNGLTDGTWTVTVDSTVPVVTGVRASTIDASAGATTGSAAGAGGDLDGGSSTAIDAGRHLDTAWFAAAAPLGTAAAAAVGAGPGAQLALENPTGRAALVALAGAASGEVRVPAGASAVVTVPRAGVVRLTGARGLVAAVSYAGSGALAGYPASPEDQAARKVLVSH